jgi:hypothetical protein
VDRERLADIVYLVRDLEGFDGVFETRGLPSIVIRNDRSRARAASRVTALPAVDVNIVSSARDDARVDVSAAELDAAAVRDARRRGEWARFRLEEAAQPKALPPVMPERTLLVVSASAWRYAGAIRSLSEAPLQIYGINDAARVVEMLAKYALPNVILFDKTLEGTRTASDAVRSLYPNRFGVRGSVRWIDGTRGLLESDVQRVLRDLYTSMRPATEPFANVRILVVDAMSGLGREVVEATPGAKVEIVDGWTALERLDAEQFDLVVGGEETQIGLASLVRFVRGCEPAPAIVIASDFPKSSRMRATFPHLAHYFIDRPVFHEDLRRVLRMP